MPRYYVVSTSRHHCRLCNDGQFRWGHVTHGTKPINVKEFKSLGWAKRAACKASDNQPWNNDVIVIMVEADEYLASDGHVERKIDGFWQDIGFGRQVSDTPL
jgi:hypothetical protein